MCSADREKRKKKIIKDAFNVVERMLATHEAIRDKILLEIGCGDGRITDFLRKYTRKIIGIDTSTAAIEQAKKAIIDVNFSVQSGESLFFSIIHLILLFFLCRYTTIIVPPLHFPRHTG